MNSLDAKGRVSSCVCMCVCVHANVVVILKLSTSVSRGKRGIFTLFRLGSFNFSKSWLDVHVADHPQVLYLLPCSCSFFRSFITPSVTLTRLAYIKTELFPETENHYNFFKNIVLPKDNIYLLCANLCSKYFVLINLSNSHSDLMK